MHRKVDLDSARNIISSLDLYSRIYMGQYSRLLEIFEWNGIKNIESVEGLLLKARNIMYPELSGYGIYGSYGIYSDAISDKAGIAYDIQQQIRYVIAWFLHPDGGCTVDFGRPLWSDRDPYKAPIVSCARDADNVIVDITACEEQWNIIDDALMIDGLIDDLKIYDVMKYYTDDSDVLDICMEIQKII